MASRTRFLLLGFSLIACRMDNPAFDAGDELADDGASDEFVEVGESGDAATSENDTDASTSQSTSSDDAADTWNTSDTSDNSDDNTTGADCGIPCGACHACSDEGICVPTPGVECADALLHCSDYLYGSEQLGGESACFALAETMLLGSCDEQGVCKPPSPDICPFVKGEIHFACDFGCVTNNQGCTPLAAADDVGIASMCAVEGEGPGCHTQCSEQLNSVQHKSCSNGLCGSNFVELCNGYACNPDTVACYESCQTIEQCEEGFVCFQSNCSLP